MTIKDCINFSNENKTCYLATAENDQPHVRALGFWFADETGFYFQATKNKEFIQQLKKNPKSEVCFFDYGAPKGRMMRITGAVEFVDSDELRKKVFKDKPFLPKLGLTIDSPNLAMFRIPHGKAHFWGNDNSTNKEIIEF